MLDIDKLINYLGEKEFEYKYKDENGYDKNIIITLEDNVIIMKRTIEVWLFIHLPEDKEKLKTIIQEDFEKGTEFVFSEEGIIN